MANKIKEIKGFFKGILASFSSSDVQDDNASFSLNIDSSDKDGVLKGVKRNKPVIEIGEGSEIETDMSVSVENTDGTYDVIYTETETGNIKTIADLYGGKELKTPINASGAGGAAKSMEVKNDKIHIGHGKELPPKILFKTKNIPFQRDSTDMSEWIYEDSTLYDTKLLNASFTVDRFINLPWYADNSMRSSIGIRYDHKDVYFINWNGEYDNAEKIYDFSSDSASIALGENNIGRSIIQGAACDVCQADVKKYADGIETESVDDYYFWALSVSSEQSEANSFGILQKFKMAAGDASTPGAGAGGDISLENTYTIDCGDSPPPEGAVPGSVLETKNHLWVQYWKPSGDKFLRDENFLYSIPVTSIENATSLQFENKSPNYDDIKQKRATINLGNKNVTKGLRETYFYNATKSWNSLKSGNWLRGDSDWGNKRDGKSRGQHKYSGLYGIDESAGFIPKRHGLIQSPLTDRKFPIYVKKAPWNFTEESDEDWVAVLTTCDAQLINIYTALQYTVPGGWNWSSYDRLRASDDGNNGSEFWFVQLIIL